jgi:phosphoribosylaminoimidazolecarboxamide formyltransferase/IMP cyclohydrolase
MSSQKTAIVSVYDKTGVVNLCQGLVASGWTILSTGGTEKALKDANVPVTAVSDVTKFPEILGGRVKTLHPNIHGGVLARNTPDHSKDLSDHGISSISLVVCNLYPFVEVSKKSGIDYQSVIEEIDIGGVALLRAGAKNHERVTVLCDPNDYSNVLESLKTDTDEAKALQQRKVLALKAFSHTASYDSAIVSWLSQSIDTAKEGSESSESVTLPKVVDLSAVQHQALRYGENPHQQGVLYRWSTEEYPFVQLQGKELSYNNILDLDAAYDVAFDYDLPACAIIKHLTPCGIATGETLEEAYKKAFESDTVSAFGSIIAFNRTVTLPVLEAIGQLFLEVLLAPDYHPDALKWLETKKKNCRVMKLVSNTKSSSASEQSTSASSASSSTASSGIAQSTNVLHNLSIKSVHGGLLIQTVDDSQIDVSKWKVVTEKQPDAKMLKDLEFAWKAVKHVKSNAIVFTQGTATVGIGCGQPNRLDSVRNAAAHAGEKAKGALCSSDAFFPFPDGVEAAASHGIAAIIQPGGSIRDDAVIEASNKLGLVMVFTGERHFKH